MMMYTCPIWKEGRAKMQYVTSLAVHRVGFFLATSKNQSERIRKHTETSAIAPKGSNTFRMSCSEAILGTWPTKSLAGILRFYSFFQCCVLKKKLLFNIRAKLPTCFRKNLIFIGGGGLLKNGHHRPQVQKWLSPPANRCPFPGYTRKNEYHLLASTLWSSPENF